MTVCGSSYDMAWHGAIERDQSAAMTDSECQQVYIGEMLPV